MLHHLLHLVPYAAAFAGGSIFTLFFSKHNPLLTAKSLSELEKLYAEARGKLASKPQR